MVMVYADISTLLDAIVAGDRQRVIQATLRLLGAEKVPPAKVAARVGIPAAWGDGEIHPLMALSVSGRVAEWMRSLPIGSEPGAETRRDLAPALPLVQGFLAVAEPLRRGLPVCPSHIQSCRSRSCRRMSTIKTAPSARCVRLSPPMT